MQTIVITISGLIVGYTLLLLVVYLIQVRLILNPSPLPDTHEFRFDDPFEESFLFPKNGVRINCLQFKAIESKGVVLYLHGKSRNLEDWAKHYKDFTSKGFDFFVYDYRKFGKSRGPLSEKALYNDAKFVYRHLAKEYPEGQIIIYGRSLGSGIATKLAQEVQAPHLMLETPYLSMEAMAQRIAWYLPVKLIIKYPIPTFKFLRNRKKITYVFHGTEDEFIPFRHSVRLKIANKNSLKLFPIYGGMHDDLGDFKEYHDHLEFALQECIRSVSKHSA